MASQQKCQPRRLQTTRPWREFFKKPTHFAGQKNYNGRVFCSWLLGFPTKTVTFILGKTLEIVFTIGFHWDKLKDIAARELVH